MERVTLRHGRVIVTVEVDLGAVEQRGRIVEVRTKAGELVTEPMEAEVVTELCLAAVEQVARAKPVEHVCGLMCEGQDTGRCELRAGEGC